MLCAKLYIVCMRVYFPENPILLSVFTLIYRKSIPKNSTSKHNILWNLNSLILKACCVQFAAFIKLKVNVNPIVRS